MKKISLILVLILIVFNSLSFSKEKKEENKLKSLEEKIEVLLVKFI